MYPATSTSAGRPRWRAWLALSVLGAALGLPSAAAAGPLTRVTSFGSNPGDLLMYTYVPSSLPASAPLVVVLHGCSQTAAEYYHGAGWDKLAAAHGFAVVVPEQQAANNSSRCFNWFAPGDHTRGQGEAASIKSMVDHMLSQHSLDRGRVFVTGLSAGGAMSAVMMATYPEIFAGGAIMAGVPYKCATSAASGLTCMRGVNKTPQQWGDLVRGATSHTGPWPVLTLWHGTSDATVKDVNMNELMEQWTNVHGADQVADETSTAGNVTHKRYKGAGGAVVVETRSISKMGHATAIDPGPGPAQCGVAGSYLSDQDICSSYHSARFWGLIAP